MPTLTDTPVIKQIPKSELMQVVDIWSLAYNMPWVDPVAGDQNERAQLRDVFADEFSYLIGAYIDGKLAATAGIIDFQMHFGDRWITCGGIAGVTTYPQFRRKRLVRALLNDCVQKLDADGVAISSLWPFSYAFYEKLGWATTDMAYIVEADLSWFRTIRGDASNFHYVDPANFSEAAVVHERWCNSLNMSLRRTYPMWNRMLQSRHNRSKLFVHKNGYMLWNFGQAPGSCLDVAEWCYLNDEAFNDGLALLSQMDSQFTRVKIMLPEIESLMRFVGIAKAPQVRVIPGMMSRVVNVEAFLKATGAPSDTRMNLSDPMGISAPDQKDASGTFGPGALVQHTIGFWKTPQPELPESLYKVAGQHPAFSIERY